LGEEQTKQLPLKERNKKKKHYTQANTWQDYGRTSA
jgi:hypothetical protein